MTAGSAHASGGARLTGPADTGLDHQQSLTLLEQQTTILEMLAAGDGPADVLAAVALALETHLPDSWCSVLHFDAPAGRLRHGAAPSLPAAYNAAIDGIPVGPRSGSCGAAAHLARQVVARDIRTDPRWRDFRDVAAAHHLRACWSTPILGSAGEVLGTFAVYHDVPHVPTRREARLVDRYRHLAAIAISHSRLWGALAEREEQFRRAFEDTAVGMALLDLSGRFIRVNRAMGELLGRDQAGLLGCHFTELTHPDDVAASAEAFAAVIREGGSSSRMEKRYLRADGSPIWVDMTASVVRDPRGRPLHVSTNVLDLTARNAAELESRARRDAELARSVAETASRAKSDFLSTMSHELRTPLSAIVGFTELLESLDLSGERRTTALGHIGRAARHIMAILDDVLDLAKIEAGAVAISRSPVRVAPIVRQTRELLEPLAAERQLTITAAEPPAGADLAAATVLADPRRLRQVLLNVVSNAIKYNRPGGALTIDLARRPESAAAEPGEGVERIVITVRDTGPGIPAEVQARLFTPFDRLGAERGPEHGAGLGLVVTDRLVAAMGGTLVIHSHAGGTTAEIAFDATVPASQPASPPAGARPRRRTAVATPAQAAGRVLYVEDDRAHRDLVAEILRARPRIALATAGRAAEALSAAATSPPDLVLLDLDLPDLAGEQVIAVLDADPRTASIPVCVLSGRAPALPEDRRVPVRWLPKPLEPDLLLALVDDLLGVGRRAPSSSRSVGPRGGP